MFGREVSWRRFRLLKSGAGFNTPHVSLRYVGTSRSSNGASGMDVGCCGGM